MARQGYEYLTVYIKGHKCGGITCTCWSIFYILCFLSPASYLTHQRSYKSKVAMPKQFNVYVTDRAKEKAGRQTKGRKKNHIIMFFFYYNFKHVQEIQSAAERGEVLMLICLYLCKHTGFYYLSLYLQEANSCHFTCFKAHMHVHEQHANEYHLQTAILSLFTAHSC